LYRRDEGYRDPKFRTQLKSRHVARVVRIVTEVTILADPLQEEFTWCRDLRDRSGSFFVSLRHLQMVIRVEESIIGCRRGRQAYISASGPESTRESCANSSLQNIEADVQSSMQEH
jgi:hypothetical protein